jgi:Family of unknown function (DUF5681)
MESQPGETVKMDYEQFSVSLGTVYSGGLIFRRVRLVGKFTPDTRVAIIRVKKRPRGKSFEPGNGFGAEHRFKKGMPSANPSGRPLCKEVNAASRSFLASGIHKSPRAQTNAEAIVAAQGRKAKKGDLGAAQFLADRAEGRPAVSVHTDAGGDNLAILIGMMAEESAKVGPPEGQIRRQQLTERNDSDN